MLRCAPGATVEVSWALRATEAGFVIARAPWLQTERASVPFSLGVFLHLCADPHYVTIDEGMNTTVIPTYVSIDRAI